jgi:hypothetical protein
MRKYLALASGLARFVRDSTCPALLGNAIEEGMSPFIYGAITLFSRPFQSRLIKCILCNFPTLLQLSQITSRYPDGTTSADFNVPIGLG